ncbi:MAG: hypothetical protein SPLM_01720 [Spiroplasma phoeniceum]|uniref:hypothetical protein n=1 Tax=Spiroplasma phoeniceum TaxID=47835 RepID=UPI0032857357
MNFKHSFNNGLGNKLESNQQQTSLNQGNNFNVSQQNYQQKGPNQNYNPVTSGRSDKIFRNNNIHQQEILVHNNINSKI